MRNALELARGSAFRSSGDLLVLPLSRAFAELRRRVPERAPEGGREVTVAGESVVQRNRGKVVRTGKFRERARQPDLRHVLVE